MNKKYIDFVPKNAAKGKLPSEGVPSASGRAVSGRTLTNRGVVSEHAVLERAEDNIASKTEVAKKKERPRILVRPAFVNTEKVRKRPLSKNSYPKKAVVSKEEVPSAPVTIIDKPEKDSKVGTIVTIIITIILGAAAGTVAFLLLPK